MYNRLQLALILGVELRLVDDFDDAISCNFDPGVWNYVWRPVDELADVEGYMYCEGRAAVTPTSTPAHVDHARTSWRQTGWAGPGSVRR